MRFHCIQTYQQTYLQLYTGRDVGTSVVGVSEVRFKALP